MATRKSAASRRNSNAEAAVHPTSAVTVATRNLINMAFVAASCATILLVLMMVRKF